MSIYVGGIGKDNSWMLASDCQLISFDEEKKEFIGLASMNEALKYHEQDARYTLYAWVNGIWKKVSFLAPENNATCSIGFTSN